MVVGALGRRPLLIARLADDRHARLGGLPAEPRLPAAAGAVRPLRPGAVGRRRDGEDHDACSTPSPRSATSPIAHRRPRSRATCIRPRDVLVRPRPGAARDRASTCRPAAALRSSASRAAASRRLRSSSAASTTRTTARSASTATTCARSSCAAYRRQLGVVLQDPFLFAGTIADNIRFAQPDATDEEVADVAQCGRRRPRSRAASTTASQHAVREGGAGLSAGERQLISIARALLADPRILILDEATSNIDRPTEILIERALDRLLRGRTSIIIAHRLATVRRADEILVLEHGRITQRGTFDELLAVDGPFRRLAQDLEGLQVSCRSGRHVAAGHRQPRRATRRASPAPSPSSGSTKSSSMPARCVTAASRELLRARRRSASRTRRARPSRTSPCRRSPRARARRAAA